VGVSAIGADCVGAPGLAGQQRRRRLGDQWDGVRPRRFARSALAVVERDCALGNIGSAQVHQLLDALPARQQVQAQDCALETVHAHDGLPVAARLLHAQRVFVRAIGRFIRLGICRRVMRDVVRLEPKRNTRLGARSLRSLVCRPNVAAQFVGSAILVQLHYAPHHVRNLLARDLIGGQAGHPGPGLHDVQLDDAAHVGMGSTALEFQVVGIVAQQVFQGELPRLDLGLRRCCFGLLRLGLDGEDAAIVPAGMVLLGQRLTCVAGSSRAPASWQVSGLVRWICCPQGCRNRGPSPRLRPAAPAQTPVH